MRQLVWAGYVVLAIESRQIAGARPPVRAHARDVASLVVYGAMLIQLPRMSRAAF